MTSRTVTKFTNIRQTYGIFSVELDLEGKRDGKSRATIHFILGPSKPESAVSIGFVEDRFENELQGAAMERIEIAVQLYPQAEKLETRAYGFRAGDLLPVPVDDTYKDMDARYARFHWLFQLNRIAGGLVDYKYRPEDWAEYASKLLHARRQVADNLAKLRALLEMYLKRTKGVDSFKGGLFDEKAWNETKKLLNNPPSLPKTAVDPWGFSSESFSRRALNPLEALFAAKANSGEYEGFRSPVMSRAIVAKEYAPFLKAKSEFSQSASIFFEKAVHVLRANLNIKRERKNVSKRRQMKDIVVQKGYRTDLADLAVRYYWNVQRALPEFQKRFRELLSPFADEASLDKLEKDETEFVRGTWLFWHWFALDPCRAWQAPQRQVSKSFGVAAKTLEIAIDEMLARFSTSEKGRQRAVRLKTNSTWEGKSSLWIWIDIDYATEYHTALERLLHEMGKGLEKCLARYLTAYVQESRWETTVVVPTVRGKMIDTHCYPIDSKIALYSGNSMDKFLFSYLPAAFPAEKFQDLGIEKWDFPEIQHANNLHKSLAEVYILSSQLAEFADAPIDLTREHAIRILQVHFKEKSEQIEKSLELAIESYRHFREYIRSKKRTALSSEVWIAPFDQAFASIKKIDFSDGATLFALILDGTQEYLGALKELAVAGLDLRLRWLDEVVDEFD